MKQVKTALTNETRENSSSFLLQTVLVPFCISRPVRTARVTSRRIGFRRPPCARAVLGRTFTDCDLAFDSMFRATMGRLG